ncbi:hypothetical protein Acsp01_43090 [Actinoplanes sp. NBRC 101535]|nr:hypothetical protein Acsp01_43090 [Actinoplanes sp. NBRC 101535]
MRYPCLMRISRLLLLLGATAGPLYVAVSVTEVFTRDGFDATRHAWSMLGNGAYGGIHSTLLVVSGLLEVCGAAGLYWVTRSRWTTVLLALYGLGMIGGGFFTADPGRGFPPGTPEEVPVSTHGILHFVFGGIGFLGLAAASVFLARRFAAEDERQLALCSWATGALLLVTFVALAATGGPAWALVAFTAAVVLVSGWLTAVFLHYRGTA